MKKTIIAALVGGAILFIWQFLSWALINFHEPAQQFTPKQEAIMNFLNSQQLEPGGYLLPTAPRNASMEEWQQMEKTAEGKPWASIQYHKEYKTNMVMGMIRSFLTNVITILLLCWILARMAASTFRTILLASIFTGLIAFLNIPYTNSIWYESFDIWAHLGDAIVSWGLTGLWLGWWLTRNRPKPMANHSYERKEAVIA